jgi:hypothetical protein
MYLLGGHCSSQLVQGKANLREALMWLKAVHRHREGKPIGVDPAAYFASCPYKATLEFPFNALYKEIHAAIPSAKFILTVRDADRWYAPSESLFVSEIT